VFIYSPKVKRLISFFLPDGDTRTAQYKGKDRDKKSEPAVRRYCHVQKGFTLVCALRLPGGHDNSRNASL
jgi:hypothetical protein